MQIRVISYNEIEGTFRQVLSELSSCPLDEENIIEIGGELTLLLKLSVSQMQAGDADFYPERSNHLAILKKASAEITYKISTCTVDEIASQVNTAYRHFGVQ